MADVSRVHGPGGAPEQPGGKKPPSEAQKFKELMRVQKTPEADPEEHKKRKRREETEEEQAAQAGQQQPQPTAPPTAGAESPFKVKGEGIKPDLSKLASTPSVGAPPPTFAPEGAEEEQQYFNEESFIESFPTAPEPSEQPSLPPSTPAFEGPTPPEQQPQQPMQAPPSAAKPKTEPAPTAITPPAVTPPKEVIKTPTARPLTRQEERQRYLEEAQKTQKPKEAIEKRTIEDEDAVPLPPSTAAAQPTVSKAKDEKEERKVGAASEIFEGAGITLPPALPDAIPAASTTPPPYAFLHPQVLDMFERMVGVMTIMQDTGVRETTITLNNPQFASSVFFGAQIIIQEFSTAPMAYNIQFVGSPQGIALFQGNVSDLMAAFQGGNYNFRVNRIETSLQTDRPLFRRKEGPSGEDTGQGQGRQQQ